MSPTRMNTNMLKTFSLDFTWVKTSLAERIQDSVISYITKSTHNQMFCFTAFGFLQYYEVTTRISFSMVVYT